MKNQTPSSIDISQAKPEKTSKAGIFLFVIFAVAVMATINHLSKMPLVEPDTPKIAWGSDYDEGLKLAKTENKPVLLCFTATWCPPCNQMKKTTYHDAKVVALTEDKFIPILIDTDVQPALAMRLNDSGGIPAYYLLNSEGIFVSQFIGYHDGKTFLKKLKSFLDK
jgi:thiol:disulfide interchange protein